jgi:flagellar protein FliL
MADDAEANATEDAPGGKRSKKKLIMIGGLALVLLLGGGGAAVFLMGGDPPPPVAAVGAEGDAVAAALPAADPNARPVFFELPSVLVNLASEGRKAAYLRVAATLELSSGFKRSDAEEKSAAIVDAFQGFLREMRPKDLAGSGGLMRLKEELLVRANAVFGQDSVKQVLFTELLLQ